MRLEELDYDLPKSLIADYPVSPRDHSRLLFVDRKSGAREHLKFYQISQTLRPGDVLVLNNSKVLPARLFARSTSSRLELLLLEPVSEDSLRWLCLVKPSRKVRNPLPLFFDGNICAMLSPECTTGNFHIQFDGIETGQIYQWLERVGHPPLPPYIKRPAGEEDFTTYQTVFSKHPGSIAAPTAGLHFTNTLLGELQAKGIAVEQLTLHVGYGTFSPVRCEAIEQHTMHPERFEVPEPVQERIARAKAAGGRIVAVGTTSLRALESMPHLGLSGRTSLYVQPGHKFEIVDGLITNFHVPKSSLLILVSAFLGLQHTKAAYEDAISSRYRFYSYGDAMVIL